METLLNILMWGYVPEITTMALPYLLLSEQTNRDNRSLKNTASLFSGIGVVFTFMGIYVGLQGFNPLDIQASLPIILDGFKTSFSTSIIGMACSLFANWWIDSEYPLEDRIGEIVLALNQKHRQDLKHQSLLLSALLQQTKNQHEQHAALANLLETIASQEQEQWQTMLVDIIERFDEKIESRLQGIIDNLTSSTIEIAEIVAENHEFHKSIMADRQVQLVASSQMAENSVKAADGFRSLVQSYKEMESNAATTGATLEQIAALGGGARQASNSMNEFMKTFTAHFTDTYNSTITDATERQAEYLVNVVATILDKIDTKVNQ